MIYFSFVRDYKELQNISIITWVYKMFGIFSKVSNLKLLILFVVKLRARV